MDHKSIERLEHDLELAIADVMERLDKRKFPEQASTAYAALDGQSRSDRLRSGS